jgi:hypothetical protein
MEVVNENGYHISQSSVWITKCSGCGKGFGFDINLHAVKKV